MSPLKCYQLLAYLWIVYSSWKNFFVINSCDMFHVFPLLYFLSVEISYAALQLTEYLREKKIVCVQY